RVPCVGRFPLVELAHLVELATERISEHVERVATVLPGEIRRRCRSVQVARMGRLRGSSIGRGKMNRPARMANGAMTLSLSAWLAARKDTRNVTCIGLDDGPLNRST